MKGAAVLAVLLILAGIVLLYLGATNKVPAFLSAVTGSSVKSSSVPTGSAAA
jgi:hypothetical protein